jgi:hypothetical protein
MGQIVSEFVVTCIRWGQLYGPEYVNNLYRSAKKYTKSDFDFVCISDSQSGYDQGIKVLDLNMIRKDFPDQYIRQGNWQKLLLYSPQLFSDEKVVIF